MSLNHFKYELTDFDRFTADQQFVNVAQTLDRIETQTGGLTPEAVWNHAFDLLASLKNVPRPEITVQRMFSYLVSQLEAEYPQRSHVQREHTAFCILFCANYILCANDEEPDPNQDIIDNISFVLKDMPDLVPLFEAVRQMEDEQEEKGYCVEARNVLAKPGQENSQKLAERILKEIEKDIIQPIVAAKLVDTHYIAGFMDIWKDFLGNDEFLGLMRVPQFEKDYNLKLVINILALMTKDKILNISNNKLNKLLFPGTTHYKYFTTKTGNSFSAFECVEDRVTVKQIIDDHKS